ncbi:MAG: 3-deoxy-D-manno-octulosonic acid transferase [Caedimonas sp.]|nr:3-deoxy-D-manno-octulosonic acid transferase [Caedimonas sp.]
MLLRLYRAMTRTIAIPFVEYHLSCRVLAGKEVAERLEERRGKAGWTSQAIPKNARLIWIHAASVGESLSVLALIDRLLKRYPSCFVLVTTGTVTSASLLEKKLPLRAFHQFIPLDIQPWVRAFLDVWRPSLALWIESEIWPNLIWETTERKIPLVMINGRISEKSFQKWRWAKSLIQPLMRRFDACYAQSSEDARRLRLLGAEKVMEVGNLKFAANPLSYDARELKNLTQAIEDRPVWIAASTHDPEEESIVAAHTLLKPKFPDLLTILIPRHPHRGKEIRAKFEKDFCLSQRSLHEPLSSKTELYIADTLGELGLFYRLARIVFIGGSLTPIGGHNMIEPAHFGAAILHGPFMTNSKEVTALFHKAGAAIQTNTEESIAAQVEKLLLSPAQCEQMGQAARNIAQAQSQVIEKVMAGLEKFSKDLD